MRRLEEWLPTVFFGILVLCFILIFAVALFEAAGPEPDSVTLIKKEWLCTIKRREIYGDFGTKVRSVCDRYERIQ